MKNNFVIDGEEDLLGDSIIVEVKVGKERGTLILSGKKH
jgi:hypothetical protein